MQLTVALLQLFQVLNPNLFVENSKKQIDLNQSMESLFNDYFTHIKGQIPNEDIMNLFREILAEEDEE